MQFASSAFDNPREPWPASLADPDDTANLSSKHKSWDHLLSALVGAKHLMTAQVLVTLAVAWVSYFACLT